MPSAWRGQSALDRCRRSTGGCGFAVGSARPSWRQSGLTEALRSSPWSCMDWFEAPSVASAGALAASQAAWDASGGVMQAAVRRRPIRGLSDLGIYGPAADRILRLLEPGLTSSGFADRKGNSPTMVSAGGFRIEASRWGEEVTRRRQAAEANTKGSPFLRIGNSSKDPVDDPARASEAVDGLRIRNQGERRVRSEWRPRPAARHRFISPSNDRGSRLNRGGTR